MARNRKFTEEQVIQAIKGGYPDPTDDDPNRKAAGSGGIITVISIRLGCDWHTAKAYIENNEKIKQAYMDENEKVLDIAESQLINSIRAGDTNDAKWYLARKGKRRGYGEEINANIAGEMVIHVVRDGGISRTSAPEKKPIQAAKTNSAKPVAGAKATGKRGSLPEGGTHTQGDD